MTDHNISANAPTQQDNNQADNQCILQLDCLKTKIPENGYQGLFELCLLLETAQKNFSQQQSSAEETEIEYREILWGETLELAEQHLQTPLDEESIDDLIFAVIELCSKEVATENKITNLKEALISDTAQLDIPQHTKKQSNTFLSNEATETETSLNQNQLLEMLQMGLLQVRHKLNNYLESDEQNHSNQSLQQVRTDELIEEIAKFSRMAEASGFNGLKLSCQHVTENLILLKDVNHKISPEQSTLWNHWHDSLLSYLQMPLDQDMAQKILIIHCSNEWGSALSKNQSCKLLINLKSFKPVDRHDDNAEPLTLSSDDEAVSLQLPNDVHPELLESLLEELPHLTEAFSESIQNLKKGGQLDDVYTAQRIAHTIKGAGNTVGIKGIATLTHHLEDILTILADSKAMPDTAIINNLIMASDCLEEMSEALSNKSSAPIEAKHVLQEIIGLATNINNPDFTGEHTSNPTPKLTAQEYQASSQPTADENSEQQIRVPVTKIDKLLQFSNQIMFNNGQLREQIRLAGQKTRTMQNQLDLMYELGMELEELVNIRNHDLLKGVSENTTSDFDSLEMDQYNELHTCSQRIHEVATDIRNMDSIYRNELQEFDGLLMEQNQLNDSSHRDLLTLRMISVKSIIPRFQRSVRQTCRMTDKKVNLQITGEDVLIDRDILNGVVDPLMHLLRNSIDHGIESVDLRLAAGKNELGQINLDFSRTGNLITIKCQDDGSGLDLESIRNKGIQRGIIKKDSKISDEALEQLIFQPNFSTNEIITQVSGRGVGMDVVVSSIRSMGGTLHLNTKPGQGCMFKIELPLSLVHYHALLVKVGSQFLALAEHSIKQILHPDEGSFSGEGVDWTFEYEDKTYPIMTLDSLLTGVSANNNVKLEKRTIILVQHLHTKYMVLIEEIIGVKELVVKGFGKFMPKIHGVIGASILDDGSIAPVMDMQELLGQPSRWSKTDFNQIGKKQLDHSLYALIVDDSLSARRSLEQFVGDLGFIVMAARDGQEAIEMIYHQTPDIVITDMEMPRINGIELTEYIRTNQETFETPVIMITSRSTQKHKSLASSSGINAYLTKPYSEDEFTQIIMEQMDSSRFSVKVA